jgi:hypothetical protein
LTEADIEKLVQKVLSEQGNGDLTGGRPTKKNNIFKYIKDFFKNKKNKSTDWEGGYKGKLDFDILSGKEPRAVNVGEGEYYIKMHNDATTGGRPSSGKSTTPTKSGSTELAKYEIKGSELPYADNMVTPDFDEYPEAKALFETIVTSFVNYIKAGGGPKLTNVTIKGSADSGRPTLDVPSGYSKLDHPGTPYNGEKDPFKMNQYLAKTRASEYAKLLKNSVKEKSGGFELQINVLPGDNYYGKGNEFRGEEYRKITLTPNAEPLKLNTPSTTTTPGTQTPGDRVKSPSIPYRVPYYYNGKGGLVKGYKVVEDKGGVFLGVKADDVEKWGTPIFNGKLKASIKTNDGSDIENAQFYIDGKLVGVIKDKDSAPEQFTSHYGNFKYWVGPFTNATAVRNTDIQGEGQVLVAYLDQAYFLFY